MRQVMAGLALGILIVACSDGGSETRQIRGTVSMPWISSGVEGIGADEQVWRFDSGHSDPDYCTGAGGYDDITKGAQVTIRDAEDKIVGSAELGPGTTENLETAWGPCVLRFSAEVEGGSDFYTVEVSHRGKVTFSARDLDQKQNRVALTIGH